MRHGITIAAAVMAVALGAQNAAAQDRDFTVASWGGSYQEGQRDIYFKPYGDAKGMQVLEDVYLGGWAQFKAMQETSNIPWDVVQVESAEVARGCEEGLFVTLDWDRLGGRDRFIPGGASDCGMGVVVVSEVIAYNDDLVGPNKPKSLADFFDLKNFPGARGMRDDVKYNLVRALIADGVPQNEIHAVLSTPEGVDRAFAKLDTIKSELQFWTAGAQAPERLAAGDLVISIAYNGRITNATREGATNLKMVWDNHIAYLDQWVILADSPNVELAYGYLEYYADPDRQIAYSRDKLPYGPPLIEAAAKMPASMAAELPVGDNMKTAFVTGTAQDIEFWLDNLDEITERWNTWKVKN